MTWKLAEFVKSLKEPLQKSNTNQFKNEVQKINQKQTNKQTNKQAIVNYWRQIMWPIVGNESALRHIDSSPYVISFLI